ncbi:LuxR C-terminal-related transcriptional regulator [Deinococcus apachensis]|uniref:LuxR C-terminal-related transcriptional regulator n=1 Tax=Deinococcus apachensis TaxID=309886 RepID=UPI0003607092|nr:LuxR C-terminal-related transcriptional regulator [Deinococcus apachensis]
MFEQEQLLATKYHLPRTAQRQVPRARLTARLEGGLDRQLTVVRAPAGYGKTTLVASWAAARAHHEPRVKVVWVSLEASDNQVLRFWRYVLSALEQVIQERVAPAQRALEAQAPINYIIASLVNELEAVDEPFVLILDDYHQMDDPVVNRSMSFLLDHQPRNLHLVLLTRSAPAFSTARLLANRQLNEIGVNDLRCTEDEAAEFLRVVMRSELPAHFVAELNRRTEGWLVGLQLFALSMQGRPETAHLLNELRGSHRYVVDYLTDEVLRLQPPDVKTFLLGTSILERMTAELCDAVLQREDSEQLLDTVERENLFLFALDERHEWFRYHHLFVEALRTRLRRDDPAQYRELHLRASEWYRTHGDGISAVKHALEAGDTLRAADLITEMPPELTLNAALSPMVAGWLDQLPRDVVYERVALWGVQMAALHYTGQLAGLDEWHRVLSERLRTPSGSTALQGVPEAQRQATLGYLNAARASVVALLGDPSQAKALVQDALTLLPEGADDERVLAYNATSIAEMYDGHVLVAQAYGDQAAQLMLGLGQEWNWFKITSTFSVYRIWEGRLHEAWRMLDHASARMMRPNDPPVAPAAYCYVYQAKILHEWHRLDEAIKLAEQAVTLSEQSEIDPAAALGYAFLTASHLARGDFAAAVNAMDLALATAPLRGSRRFQAVYLSSTRMKLWLATGMHDRARLWCRELDENPASSALYERECDDVAKARYLVTSGAPDDAVQLLAGYLPGALEEQRGHNALEMLLLSAVAQQQRGDRQSALNTTFQAVQLDTPNHHVQLFLDEGPVMRDLLMELRDRRPENLDLEYLSTLISNFAPAPAENLASTNEDPRGFHAKRSQNQAASGSLSLREIDVLRLLGRGMTNEDIAHELDISLPTVKTHVSNVLLKLDARNRTQAVARAQQLQLLDHGDGSVGMGR